MINDTLNGIIISFLIIIIIFFPFEDIFGEYKTPEESIKASDLQPVIQTKINDNENIMVTFDEGKFTYYYLYKKAFGWTKPFIDFSYVNKYQGKLTAKIVNSRNKACIILVFDIQKHIVNDNGGNDYTAFEFSKDGTKYYAYLQTRSHDTGSYGDVNIDGVLYDLYELATPKF